MRNQHSFQQKNMPTINKKNLYQVITHKIIDKMREGNLIWKQGFRTIPAQNFVTQKAYSGINSIILNFVYGDEPCPLYCTFKQIKKLGGTVKKGSKGKLIVYYAPLFKKEGQYIPSSQFKNMDKTQQKEVQTFHVLKSYYVYNMLDTENCKFFDYDKWTNIDASPENLEDKEILFRYQELLSHYTDKPNCKSHRNKNAYIPSTDTILYVPLKRWEKVEDFVSTMCHEIIHSTGHTKRLNRTNVMQGHSFGSASYAQEELVAELGAAFLCQHISIFPSQIENSAAYLQSWIAALENDERLIFRASAQAQKALDYIFKENNELKKI